MESIVGKFIDGGPVFTVTILLAFFVIIALFVWGILKMEHQAKVILLMKHIGWFAVAWGFLGRTFGLIKAFDMVAAHGELTPRLLSDGLKMALVDPLFGIFVFVVARLGIIILVALSEKSILEQLKNE
jgi:flagellar motor component MotA